MHLYQGCSQDFLRGGEARLVDGVAEDSRREGPKHYSPGLG